MSTFLQGITADFPVRSLHRGEIVFRQGEPARGLYALESGLVGLFGLAVSGREMLYTLFRDGQLLGHRAYFSGEVHLSEARALVPVQIRFVPAQNVEELLRTQPEFARGLLSELAALLGSFGQRLADAADKPAPARIAATLLYLKDFAPDHRWRRADIADYSGSTAPTVVRTLQELEERGLLRLHGREIQIKDEPGIRRWIESAGD